MPREVITFERDGKRWEATLDIPTGATDDQIKAAIEADFVSKEAAPQRREPSTAAKVSEYAHARMPYSGAGTLIDIARGAGSGLASTAFNTEDMLRQGLGMQSVMNDPWRQDLMTAPQTIPGKLGKIGEQVGEYAIPMGRIAKATAAAPRLVRAGAQALGGGGVAALQTGGDPTAMTLASIAGGAMPIASTAIKGLDKVADLALSPGARMMVRSQVPWVARGMDFLSGLRNTLTKATGAAAKEGAAPATTTPEALISKTAEPVAEATVKTIPFKPELPKSVYMEKARAVKAAPMAKYLHENGFTAEQIRNMAHDQFAKEWGVLAKQVKVNPPKSPESVDAIVRELENLEKVAQISPELLAKLKAKGVLKTAEDLKKLLE